jgi:archaemetzincin
MTPRARKILIGVAALAAVGSWAAAKLSPPPTRAQRLRDETLEPRFEALKRLHTAPHPARRGDWLAEHPEPGESFAAYVKAGPVRATPARRTIYLQPVGDFTLAQRVVLSQTADCVGRFFQLPVTTLPDLPNTVVPDEARRGAQLLTGYILKQVLLPRRPEDALAVLALTSADLYPAPDWNFVFGEASTIDRVGVWSLARLGEPGTSLFLQRALKTATHELGHMLSMQHCVGWSCVMEGSNSLEEADRQPAALCPACLQKVTWNVGLDPAKRAEELGAFYADAGLADELAVTVAERAALKPP